MRNNFAYIPQPSATQGPSAFSRPSPFPLGHLLTRHRPRATAGQRIAVERLCEMNFAGSHRGQCREAQQRPPHCCTSAVPQHRGWPNNLGKWCAGSAPSRACCKLDGDAEQAYGLPETIDHTASPTVSKQWQHMTTSICNMRTGWFSYSDQQPTLPTARNRRFSMCIRGAEVRVAVAPAVLQSGIPIPPRFCPASSGFSAPGPSLWQASGPTLPL